MADDVWPLEECPLCASFLCPGDPCQIYGRAGAHQASDPVDDPDWVHGRPGAERRGVTWPRCALCGARLGRDETQLVHEFSGRCGGHQPPPKHIAKKDKRDDE